MADAALAAHEQHGDVGDRAQRHAVVAGAGGQPAHLQPFGGDRAVHLRHQPRRARRHAELLQGFDFDLRGSVSRAIASISLPDLVPLHDAAARRCGARTSTVNTTSPGITLIAPGCASMRPTVPTSSGVALRDALDGEHALGGGGERVAPQAHRHRAGVAGRAATA